MKKLPSPSPRLLMRLCLVLSLLPLSLALKAQDINVRYATLDSLITLLEARTSYHFYYAGQQTDTLLITLRTQGKDPIQVLGEELKKAGFSLGRIDQNNLYIFKGEDVQQSLSDDFYARLKDLEARPVDYRVEDLSRLALQAQQMADSENRLYTLGDPLMADTPGTVRLTGIVRDHITGEPVANISLFTEDKSRYTMSDSYGAFAMVLPRGYTTLNLQGFGYKDSHRYLRIFSDSSLDINIEEEVFALQGITISAEKMENVRSVQMGVEKVRADRIRHIPTAFGEADVIKVVLTLPGVKSVGEAAGGFNVRGGATDQNLILFNEGTIYNPSHLFGLFSLFNSDIVNNIELYKSSVPARYGGRISSVLEVNSREGNKNKITGSAGVGLLTTKLTLEGPIVKDKTSFILAGRTTYSDWLLNMIPENSGYNDGTANFYDINAGLSHKFNENNYLYVTGYYSRDNFAFSPDTTYMYQNLNTSIRYRSILSDNSTMVISGAYDRYNYHNIDKYNASSSYDMAFTLQQYSLKADFNTRLNDNHKLNFGANGFYYVLDPGTYLPLTDSSLVVPDIMEREQAMELALYAGDTWDVTPKLSLEAGVRYTFYAALGPKTYNLYQDGSLPSLRTVSGTTTVGQGKMVKPYHGPEIRASLRYSFTPSFSLKAGFNSMRQNIHMLSNTTVISPTDTWKLSDANIRPQTGWQTAMGLYKNFMNNTLECSVEGYYKHLNNYLDYAGSAQLLMNHHIETDVIGTEGRAYGVEVSMKRSLGRLNGWLSYTYSRTLLRQNGPNVASPINGGNWYPAAYDKPHDVKLVGNFKITHRFSFSANLDYSTGRPITMPVGTYYFQGGWRLHYTDRNSSRIPDYFRLDIAFNIEPSHKLTLLTHSSFTVGVYNVTGRQNPYSVFFKSEENTVKSYKLSIFGCPIPYITYNIKF